MWRLALVGVALAAVVAGVLIAVLGEGKSAGEAELGQQRAHLALVAGELYELEAPLRREVSAARAVWGQIYTGLPGSVSDRLLREISEANAAAAAIPQPQFVQMIPELTGPGARVARLFHSFLLLSTRGWSHIQEAAEALRSGSPSRKQFARRTVGLYIDSVYNALFDLTTIGEKTLVSYERFGGGQVFGSALTPSQAQSIAKTFSPEADELKPHEWQRLQVR